MWCKQLTVNIKNCVPITVLVFLNDSLDDNKEQVRVFSIVNEYFLIEDIIFSSRDAAYEFIKHFPVSLAKDFVIRNYIQVTGELL